MKTSVVGGKEREGTVHCLDSRLSRRLMTPCTMLSYPIKNEPGTPIVFLKIFFLRHLDFTCLSNPNCLVFCSCPCFLFLSLHLKTDVFFNFELPLRHRFHLYTKAQRPRCYLMFPQSSHCPPKEKLSIFKQRKPARKDIDSKDQDMRDKRQVIWWGQSSLFVPSCIRTFNKMM